MSSCEQYDGSLPLLLKASVQFLSTPPPQKDNKWPVDSLSLERIYDPSVPEAFYYQNCHRLKRLNIK